MSEIELNYFLLSLVKVLPSTLCLNTIELLMFHKASIESATTIQSLKNDAFALNYIQKILTETKMKLCEQTLNNLSISLSYNCEIILIFHKFQTLIDVENESDNIALILRKITHGNK